MAHGVIHSQLVPAGSGGIRKPEELLIAHHLVACEAFWTTLIHRALLAAGARGRRRQQPGEVDGVRPTLSIHCRRHQPAQVHVPLGLLPLVPLQRHDGMAFNAALQSDGQRAVAE